MLETNNLMWIMEYYKHVKGKHVLYKHLHSNHVLVIVWMQYCSTCIWNEAIRTHFMQINFWNDHYGMYKSNGDLNMSPLSPPTRHTLNQHWSAPGGGTLTSVVAFVQGIWHHMQEVEKNLKNLPARRLIWLAQQTVQFFDILWLKKKGLQKLHAVYEGKYKVLLFYENLICVTATTLGWNFWDFWPRGWEFD